MVYYNPHIIGQYTPLYIYIYIYSLNNQGALFSLRQLVFPPVSRRKTKSIHPTFTHQVTRGAETMDDWRPMLTPEAPDGQQKSGDKKQLAGKKTGTPPKTNGWNLKNGWFPSSESPNFQGSIFRFHVSFRGSTLLETNNLPLKMDGWNIS